MQIKITNKLSDKIAELKRQNGTTKTFIADKLGISKQQLKNLEKANNMYLDMALKLCIFFDCELSDLFEYKEIKSDKIPRWLKDKLDD